LEYGVFYRCESSALRLEGLRHFFIHFPSYDLRVYAFTDAAGKTKPGMIRVLDGGADFHLELWDMPTENFGKFIAQVRAASPLLQLPWPAAALCPLLLFMKLPGTRPCRCRRR
jgi:hypothetical protein